MITTENTVTNGSVRLDTGPRVWFVDFNPGFYQATPPMLTAQSDITRFARVLAIAA